MSLAEIFERERDRYVNFLAETRKQVEAEHRSVVGELLISINDESIPYPYRYIRVDMLSKAVDGSIQGYEVKITRDPSFEPRGFDFGGFVVELYPFTWDAIQFVTDQPFPNLPQIESWITRWLDVDDEKPTDPRGLCQAIHSFTQVGHNDSWWYLTGDFGSAPAHALVEFVDLLAAQGLKRIIIKTVPEND